MSDEKSKTGSREQEAGSSNSFGAGDNEGERIEKIPEPTQELLSRICRHWRREICGRQRQKYIRRSIKSIISTALIHIDRLETFAPIDPPEHIKNFLKKANIFTLQGVFSEVLLNLFTRFHQTEEE